MMFSPRCECMKCLWSVPFKMVNFMVCGFHLNKTILSKRLPKKIIHMRDDGGFSEGGSSGGGKTWLESASLLKVELTEFADGLGVGRERKRSQK